MTGSPPRLRGCILPQLERPQEKLGTTASEGPPPCPNLRDSLSQVHHRGRGATANVTIHRAPDLDSPPRLRASAMMSLAFFIQSRSIRCSLASFLGVPELEEFPPTMVAVVVVVVCQPLLQLEVLVAHLLRVEYPMRPAPWR